MSIAGGLPAPSGIVTLLTDFGTQDPFVGVMKGVMLRVCPALQPVDLTHDIAPQDVSAAAFWLQRAYDYFPGGTVHLVVVDPGVGSSRRALAACANGHYFVGPDNGVLSGALGAAATAVELPVPATASRTFHGRDVFAPAAAALALGHALTSLGAVCGDWVRLAQPEPVVRTSPTEVAVAGQVVVVDHFGNLITNLRHEHAQGVSHVVCKGKCLRWVRNYADAEPGEIVALQNSWGLVELAQQGGSAEAQLAARAGDAVELLAHRRGGG